MTNTLTDTWIVRTAKILEHPSTGWIAGTVMLIHLGVQAWATRDLSTGNALLFASLFLMMQAALCLPMADGAREVFKACNTRPLAGDVVGVFGLSLLPTHVIVHTLTDHPDGFAVGVTLGTLVAFVTMVASSFVGKPVASWLFDVETNRSLPPKSMTLGHMGFQHLHLRGSIGPHLFVRSAIAARLARAFTPDHAITSSLLRDMCWGIWAQHPTAHITLRIFIPSHVFTPLRVTLVADHVWPDARWTFEGRGLDTALRTLWETFAEHDNAFGVIVHSQDHGLTVMTGLNVPLEQILTSHDLIAARRTAAALKLPPKQDRPTSERFEDDPAW